MTADFACLEQVQADVLEVLLALINQLRFSVLRSDLYGDEVLWSLLEIKPKRAVESSGDAEETVRSSFSHPDYANPDLHPQDLGLTFADVAETGLATELVHLYEYGVLAELDVSAPSLDDDEGGAAWASRTLFDLAHSKFIQEWSDYAGDRAQDAAKRLLAVAELANARLLLEGGTEGFFLDERDVGFLTFRQLSLLSGMTEASLRTLASRAVKAAGANDGSPASAVGALRTVRKGNAAYIEVEDARAFLQARNRYLPVRQVHKAGGASFVDRRYSSVAELQSAVSDRIEFLEGELGSDETDQRLAACDIQWTADRVLSFPALLSNASMRRLAEALEWPSELFALRAAETALAEQLRSVERQLREAQASSAGKPSSAL